LSNLLTNAANAKGALAALKRISMITRRYGLSSLKMERALDQFVRILNEFNFSATFPATAVAVERRPEVFQRYQAQGIEFAVHGYTHIDYAQLAPDRQQAHLQQGREIFSRFGLAATGFRSPYLRRSEFLHQTVATAGFTYVSNQPVMWDVLDLDELSAAAQTGYRRAVDYYQPQRPAQYVSTPRLINDLVEIPVSLPDDEILLDRLGSGGAGESVETTWLKILAQTYQRGELFTIQLHPERIAACAAGLRAALAKAQTLSPKVWVARLDELASWWREKADTSYQITTIDEQTVRVEISTPAALTILTRFLDIDAPGQPWFGNYQQINAKTFTITSSQRPFIGLSPDASLELVDFLQQQGYIIEYSLDRQSYGLFFDQTEFSSGQEYPLLSQIEETECPLVRFGRWPDGAHSALAITGDIDALTLWDYGLRMVGR